jgi:hypothetical protein
MNLVTCPSCGGQIAEQYSECPQCGQSMRAPVVDAQELPGGQAAGAQQGPSADDDPDVQQGLAEGRLRTCPDCRAPVSTRLASCHRCGHPFGDVPEARGRGPAGPDAEAGWRNAPGWGTAYRGLRLYRHGLITYVIAVFVSYVILVMAAVAESPILAVTCALVAGLALLIGHAMMVTGQYRFTSIPKESGANGLAWAGFVGGLVAVSLAAIALVLVLSGSSRASASAVSGVGSMAWVVGSVCFILALAGVARYVESPQLGRQAIIVLILLLVFVGLGIGYEFIAYLIKNATGPSMYNAEHTYSTKADELRGLAVIVLVPWAAVGLFYLLKFLQLLATLTAILGEAAIDSEGDAEDFSY